MAEPITWRNVTGPSLADASRPLQIAQQSLTSGMGNFVDQLKSMEATDAANFEQVKKNNTNEFMNRLMEAQTAEQFGNMNSGNAMGKMLAGYGAQIDQAAARTALDQRLGTLQDRDVRGITYNNTMLDEKQAPMVREIQMLSLTDPEQAKARLAENPDIRKAFELATGIDTREWLVKERGWKEEMQPLEIQGKKADIDYKGAQTTLAKAQADHQIATAERERAYINALKANGYGGLGSGTAGLSGVPGESGSLANGGTPALAAVNAQWKETLKNSVYGGGDYSTAEGKKELDEILKRMNIPPTQADDIRYNLSKYYKDGAVIGHDDKGRPIRAPLPVATIVDAISASGESNILSPLIPGWSRRGDDVVNTLDTMFGVDGKGNKVSRGDSYRADLVAEMAAIRDMQAQRDARLAGTAVPTVLQDSTDPNAWKKAPKGKSVMFPKPR
jgi:hypothetical protein